MPGWSFRRTALVLVLVVLVLHVRPALRVPMIEDDFRLNRPWTSAEVTSVWHGTWMPDHDGDRYYRPLAAMWHAATFEVFGWHQAARSTVSLLLLTAIAVLLAALVTAEAGALAGLLTGLVYLVNPLLPEAVSGITFNQFHEWATLAVLGAWYAWRRHRGDGARGWWWPAAWVTLGALIKEDTLAVLPAIVVWHGLRAATVGDVPALTRRALLTAAGALAVMLAGRALAYSEVEWAHAALFAGPDPGGLTLDVLRHGAGFMGRSLSHLFVPVGVSVLAVGLNVWALGYAARRRRGALAWLVGAGAVLVLTTGGPLTVVLNTHHTRSHLVALGGSMLVGGALTMLWTVVASRPRVWRLAAAGLAAIILTGFAGGLRGAYARLEPCRLEEPEQIAHDLPWLDPNVAQWIRARPSMCATGAWVPVETAAPVIVWRRPIAPLPAPVPPSTVALVLGPARAAAITLRSTDDAAPAAVATVRADGASRDVPLTGAGWQTVVLPLSPTWRSRLRGGTLVTITGANVEVREVRVPPDAR